jgi:hypothetical protein
VIETIMNSGFQGDDIMNKKWNIIMVLMLMVPLASYALADDADDTQQDEIEINEETQKEIEIMSDHLGAQIRLLQLEKAITKNIAKGNEVIAALKEADINTTILEAILAELELVKEEVQSADPNATDAVQIFIGLKADAIELSKEFRDTVRTLIDEKTQEQLRERIQEMVCERIQNLSRKIQNRIRQFNRDQVQRIYGVLGETNMSIQNGAVTQEQLKIQVRTRIQNMTSEKKFDVYSELAQYKIRTRIQAHVSVDNATDHFRERQEERLTNRLRMAQGQQNGADDPIQAAMEQRMRNRLNNLNEDDNGSDNGTNNTNGSNNNDQGNSDTGNGNKSDEGNGNNDDNHQGNNNNTSGGSGRP